MNWKFGIVFIFHLIMGMYFPDFWANPNSTSRVLASHALVTTGSLKIDERHELTMDKCLVSGHYYSEKAPLPIYIVSAVYFVGITSGIIDNSEDLRPIYFLGDLLSAAALATVITMLFYYLLRKYPPWKAFLISALPFYGSFVYVFTGTFFSHVFSGALIVLSWHFLQKHRWLLAGILAGMAFLSEFLLLLMAAAWILQLIIQQKWKPVILYTVGLVPFGLFMLVYNHVIGGDAFTMLYKYTDNSKDLYGLGLPNPDVIFELLFPDYRGILFYMPVLLFFTGYLIVKRPKISIGKFLSDSVILPVLIYFLAFSSFHDWWGGWSYGPRQLIPPAMLITYYGLKNLELKDSQLLALFAVSGVGIAMALMSKATVIYSLPTIEKHPFFSIILQKVALREFNDQHILSIFQNVQMPVAIVIWITLFVGLSFIMKVKPDLFKSR